MSDDLMSESKWVDVLNTIVRYNGLGEAVLAWKDLSPSKHGYILPDYWERGYSVELEAQLELIWMIAVIWYGDYGTSPRSGWIKHIDEFHNFIDAITNPHLEQKEEDA